MGMGRNGRADLEGLDQKVAPIVRSLFSQMNLTKNNLKSRMIDDSLSASILFKVIEYEPDIKRVASKVQPQKSHWHIALYGFKCIVGNNLYSVRFALVLFNVTGTV